MKLEPLTKFKAKPYCVLYPSQRGLMVRDATGDRVAYGRQPIEQLLAAIEGWVCYVPNSLESLVQTTGATSWKADLWRDKIIRMTHLPSGTRVSSLKGTVEDRHAYEDLEGLLKFLRGFGVMPASIPAMAWQLFRASLDRVYTVGFDPEVGRDAFYGGRQEITNAGLYKDMQLVDIEQAYPTAQARPGGYALSLRQVSNSTYLDSSAAGIARARVYVPESLPFAPLPIRVAEETITFQYGLIEGTWPWCELAAAKSLGCEVEVIECWAPQRTAELFGPWWPLAQELRKLPGGSGKIGKAISNSTWGQFGMRAQGRGTRQWADDKGTMAVNVPMNDHDMPQSWTAHIAAETTARVRTQMLLEGLYGGMVPAHIDTDGVIVPTGSPLPGDGATGPGTWRVKEDITKLDLRGPQLYRYTCPGCGVTHEHWHYNASGIASEKAPEYFANNDYRVNVKHEMRFD